MDILPLRDLIKDELGNLYVVIRKSQDSLILVNAVVYYSFRRIMNNEFLTEVQNSYEKPVAVGQFFTDIVKQQKEQLMTGEIPGNVYLLEAVKTHYKVVVNGLYEETGIN